MTEYNIVVRTFKRYEMFKQMTYSMLQDNDLTDNLYIMVANQDEKEKYEESMKGLPYKEILIAGIGCHNPVKKAVEYFPKDSLLVFLDDDLEYFFEYTGTPSKETFSKKSKNLKKYIEWGFSKLDATINIFTFLYVQNYFFIATKPFAEFRPVNISGGFFGARNSELLTTDHAHLDDIHRTCNYIEEFGGALIFNWGGFATKTGYNEGGMQDSGCRGDESTRKERILEICNEVYALPVMKKYCNPPRLVNHTGMYEVKLKTITAIKKLRHFKHTKWLTYFQDDAIVMHENSLEELM